MKQRLMNAILWLAYILALAASLGHVAATFNRFEKPNAQYGGWLAAIAVDLGLAALAYGIQQRKRARRPVRWFWFGVIIFASISAYANILHALSVSPFTFASSIVFSAVLPLLVVFLGEIVSSDDVAAAEALEREQRRLERMVERQQTQISAAITPALSQGLDAIAKVATQSVYICETCEKEFANRFALSAHAKAHKNGRNSEVVTQESAREI